ncbi:MAG TPA: 23S rRNA (guanosine(2251)-2'-O)-methyltransferase RlmB [Candidatus Competibacteraceae bacterium]|nr:23S rRNA (guanosine(2251)-2'-O)-methyltransferase RlmB [Candidatus Competibacteraceae bacterium]
MADDEIIYGLHAVQAALKYEPHSLRSLWVETNRRDPRMRALLEQAERAGVTVEFRPREVLDRLCPDGRHQGVVARQAAQALARPRAERELPEILAAAGANPLVLVLDGVQDPHNLGACLRSADAAGVCAVIAPGDRAVGLTPTARKVACGAAESVPFVQVTNLARTLRWLRDSGLWVIGAAGEAEHSLYQADLRGPLAIVLGAEDKGLRRLTREHCDQLVHIPMLGKVESLNVSVATGILLFEAVRQRNAL